MEIDLPRLNQMKDGDLEQALLDIVSARLKSMPGDAVSALSSLPKGFHTFYVSWLVEAEVRNGGFLQFFWNESSEFAEVAVDTFRTLGDPAIAEIMQQALDIAMTELPMIANYMKLGRTIGMKEAFSQAAKYSKFKALDAAFCERASVLCALRGQFFRANGKSFVTTGRSDQVKAKRRR